MIASFVREVGVIESEAEIGAGTGTGAGAGAGVIWASAETAGIKVRTIIIVMALIKDFIFFLLYLNT
jgi:hypothetical protein